MRQQKNAGIEKSGMAFVFLYIYIKKKKKTINIHGMNLVKHFSFHLTSNT